MDGEIVKRNGLLKLPPQQRSYIRKRKVWRKLLWIRQPDYPDNWVDVTFLEDLQRNVNVQAYDFWPLVADSTVITEHLSSVVLFIAAFIAIYSERVPPIALAALSNALTIAGYVFWSISIERGAASTRTCIFYI